MLVDATDGAPTKDWLNALAVRHDLPLVHAAALRSEGRLLEVPAGGRPCLACLFGRLTRDAARRVRGSRRVGRRRGCGRLPRGRGRPAPSRRPARPLAGLRRARRGGRSRLHPRGGGGPAVSGLRRGGPPGPEPYPRTTACGAPGAGPVPGEPASAERAPRPTARARPGRRVVPVQPAARPAGDRGARPRFDVLEIHLGAEGAASVPDGLRALGHELLETSPRGAGPAPAGPARRGRRAPTPRSPATSCCATPGRSCCPRWGGGPAAAPGRCRHRRRPRSDGSRRPPRCTCAPRAWGASRATSAGRGAALRVGPEGGARVGRASGATSRGAWAWCGRPRRRARARARRRGAGSRRAGPRAPCSPTRPAGYLVREGGKWEPPAIVLGGDGTIATRPSPAAHP